MKLFFSAKAKLALPQILIITPIALAFSYLVIQNFSTPLVGGGDIDSWEYTGFYFLKNLSFSPLPHLSFINDQTFYPYGTNAVFQSWSIERDSYYALMYSLFRFGAWLQFYYLFSLIFTFVGASILLVRDYGLYRAVGAGLLMSFFNFYTIHKYPHHFNITVIHWLVFSLIVDFLIVRRIILKQHLSLKLILVRICLIILVLGSELGYLAGFALMSLTISCLYLTVVIIYRCSVKKEQKLSSIIGSEIKNLKIQFLNQPYIAIFLLLLSGIFSYYYLPLVFQIAKEAKSFNFSGVTMGAWWANPLRLLIPHIRGIDPGQAIFEKVLKDSPEGYGAASPGWFLIIIGTVGLWQARKKITLFIPLLIIFLLCLFYHPAYFPTLKIFPWFTFNRVGGRATVIYPVILTIFALHINYERWRSPFKKIIAVLLVLLACTEVYTAYSIKVDSYKPYSLDKNFLNYMAFVRQQPGEAVLDWPFCVAGGNGVGTDAFCPYYRKNYAIHTFQRFHHKKVVGYTYGRLHPLQIEPYVQAGWDSLFFPDTNDFSEAKQQQRCFSSSEWNFFTDFYKFNDFAGINLYTDLLPENCLNEFYQRFGTPSIETKVVDTGRVQFIAKSPQLRKQLNLALGKTVKFTPYLDGLEANFLTDIKPSGFKEVTGLSKIEQNEQNSKWRWALGAETKITFNLRKPQPLQLGFSLTSPINNQNINIELNGTPIYTSINLNKSDVASRTTILQGFTGLNTITFKYKDWNKNGVTFEPNDDRPMAVSFNQLVIATEVKNNDSTPKQ